MEPEAEFDEQPTEYETPKPPEKKKRTLTEKQLKNLELMRQKKMAKKQASKMIEESVRNSARDLENEEFSSLKNELSEIKKQLYSKKSKKSKKEIESESESDEENYTCGNPYLNQLVRFR